MEMRRKDRKIEKLEQIKQILNSCQVLHLGLSDAASGFAYVVPVNFGYQVDSSNRIILYFHGALQGKKQDLIAGGAKVFAQCEVLHQMVKQDNPCDWSCKYSSFMGWGQCRQLQDPQEKAQALTKIMNQYGANEGLEYPQAMLARTAVFELVCEEYTAKSNNTTGE